MNFLKHLFTNLTNINNNDNDIDCPVCLDKITNDNYCKIPCGHTFHSTCIIRCNNKCPMCRTTICKETDLNGLKEELSNLQILTDSNIDKYFIEVFMNCINNSTHDYSDAYITTCMYKMNPIGYFNYFHPNYKLVNYAHATNFEIIEIMEKIVDMNLRDDMKTQLHDTLLNISKIIENST